MHLQFHLDNLGWALRHLETFVQSQLGAAGEEGLAKFRQTFDFLHGDLGSSAALDDATKELGNQLEAARQQVADLTAELAQAKQAAQLQAIGEDADLIAAAAVKVHQTYQSLLLVMRDHGELPTDIEAAVVEATGAIDTLMALAPQAEQTPTTPPAVTGQQEGTAPPSGDQAPADSAAGAPTGDANQGTGNSTPAADQQSGT